MFDRRSDAVHEEMSGVTETMLSATGAGDPAVGPGPLPEVLSAHGGADPLQTVDTLDAPDAPDAPDASGTLDALATLDALPVSEHVAVYESIHRSLQTALEEPEHG